MGEFITIRSQVQDRLGFPMGDGLDLALIKHGADLRGSLYNFYSHGFHFFPVYNCLNQQLLLRTISEMVVVYLKGPRRWMVHLVELKLYIVEEYFGEM